MEAIEPANHELPLSPEERGYLDGLAMACDLATQKLQTAVGMLAVSKGLRITSDAGWELKADRSAFLVKI